MQVLLAHPGTQHARRLACELERLGLLGEFWTGLALADHGLVARLAAHVRRLPSVQGLSNRIVPGIPRSRLHCVPFNEICALLRLRRNGNALRVIHARNKRFQDAIPDASLRACDALIAFDTSAWRLAERARRKDCPVYLDRTIAHPSAFARIEAEMHRQYPDWCPAPALRPDYLRHAEEEEHQLASRIVVGGSFARATLLAEGIAAEKIVVNSYGVDWPRFAPPTGADRGRAAQPMRFLFLGSLLARKGVPLLLDAWRRLGKERGDAELWLVGPCGERERRLIPDLPGLHLSGSVPHTEVPGLLAQIDVFVLPSYFEGFGLVLLEALAAGVPFISTLHTGAADLPADPRLGLTVPVGSVEALIAALRHYLAQPPDRSAVHAACTALQQRFSWEAYGDRWAALLREAS